MNPTFAVEQSPLGEIIYDVYDPHGVYVALMLGMMRCRVTRGSGDSDPVTKCKLKQTLTSPTNSPVHCGETRY
jgi:hypothetical protein